MINLPTNAFRVRFFMLRPNLCLFLESYFLVNYVLPKNPFVHLQQLEQRP